MFWFGFRAAAFVFISTVAAVAEDGRLTFPDVASGTVTLRHDDASGEATDQWLKVFVGPADACCEGRSPLAGRYGLNDGAVVFKPQFPLLKGQVYTALTFSSGVAIKTEFSVEGDMAPPPEVLAMYPSGPTIPENTLRFYIEFASPMQPHVAETYVTLTDAEGVPDRAAFMSFKQELWNADRTRLTLLMDPGRIKRGVAQNLDLGPAFEEGRHYTITIGAGWPGALGGRTKSDFTRTLDIAPALRERPDPAHFEVSRPRLDSRDPLIVRFDRPFDRVQLFDALTLMAQNGRLIAGDIELQDAETTWVFVPRNVWSSETLRIAIDTRLEDVAGNNFRETLDHTLGSHSRDVDTLYLPVMLRPGP